MNVYSDITVSPVRDTLPNIMNSMLPNRISMKKIPRYFFIPMFFVRGGDI